MENSQVFLSLSRAEAIVLFEWLANSSKSLAFEDDSERCVLANIECQLEKLLAEPFSPNYDEILEDARRMVRG